MSLAGIQTARQLPNPIISFGASRDTPHESLLWDQPIELGGKRGKRIALAQEEQKGTDIDIDILSRQIRRRTREAFYRVVSQRALTEQAKTAKDLAIRIRDVVQQRFEAGDVAELEVIQAEVEVARATVEYDSALQSEKGANAQLAALLNRAFDEGIELQGRLEDIPQSASLQQVTEIALRSNAEIKKTSQDVEVEKRRLDLAKAERIPNLALQAGVDFNSPNEFSVGPRGQIGVSLPLFYHGQGEVAQSSARLGFVQMWLQALRANTSAEVVAAYFDHGAKVGQAQQYQQKILPQTVRLEEMAEDSYRSGKSSLLTLIDAQRKLNETRVAYLDSLLAAQNSFAVLEEVVGTPLD
jgi:cobalt-zinc-cadmium efflux system outer membrane protein